MCFLHCAKCAKYICLCLLNHISGSTLVTFSLEISERSERYSVEFQCSLNIQAMKMDCGHCDKPLNMLLCGDSTSLCVINHCFCCHLHQLNTYFLSPIASGQAKIEHIPYFLVDNAHLMYNAHPKLFRHSF
jgi:hypothetical protein